MICVFLADGSSSCIALGLSLDKNENVNASSISETEPRIIYSLTDDMISSNDSWKGL
jgi:hypothetical protein